MEAGGAALPSTAQVAFQASEVAAWNVWSSLSASAPGPLDFRYTPLGEMLTLGPMDAAVSGLKGLFQLEGPPASLARRLVYVMRMPTGGQRLRAAKSWVRGRAERIKGQIRGAMAVGEGDGQ
jgi:demethylphylloquinone reductase